MKPDKRFLLKELLEDDKYIELLKNEPAIYRVTYCKNNKLQKIGRLLGEDKEGILYIGKSKKIRSRIQQLRNAVDPNRLSTNHTFGNKFKKLVENKNKKLEIKIKDLFNFLCIEIELKSIKELDKAETNELKTYNYNFGEVPPLNSNLPNI